MAAAVTRRQQVVDDSERDVRTYLRCSTMGFAHVKSSSCAMRTVSLACAAASPGCTPGRLVVVVSAVMTAVLTRARV